MAIHHDAAGNAFFADIFSSDSGFSGSGSDVGTTPSEDDSSANAAGALCTSSGNGTDEAAPATPPGGSMPTNPDGLTAGGVAQTEIDTAALGQSTATELAFSSDPTITDPSGTNPAYPSLYGWLFAGNGTPQLVILNLSKNAQVLDVSQIPAIANASSVTYRQISGFPGDYMTGFVDLSACSNTSNPQTCDYEAFYLDDSDGVHADDIAVIDTTLSVPTLLKVPPYSLTRIAAVQPSN
jgi:hypothetical protein